jgi:hypothetical protein
MEKIIFFFILAFISFGYRGALGQNKKPDASYFSQTITPKDAKKHLTILASDEYEGRETGKEGQKKAARYISSFFKQIGLDPASDTSYLQSFPLLQNVTEGFDLSIGGNALNVFTDYYLYPYGEPLHSTAKDVLFLGYGISDEKYDDYKGAKVKGKVLLILDGEPIDNDSISLISGTKKASSWGKGSRMKIELAKKNGAAGIFIISDKFESDALRAKHQLESPTMELATEKKDANKKYIFRGGLSAKEADKLLSSSKKNKETVAGIKRKIADAKQPYRFKIKTRLALTSSVKTQKIQSENVLGMIKGSTLPNEYVFITAHYDHIGVMDGKVYNGADDDGSGTVGVMEIAQAFMQAKQAGITPKRSIVFLTVSGEEKGLLGSAYYVEHPVFPLTNTVCDLNIDMIGRGDEEHKNDSNFVYIIGSDKISTDLHAINENANQTHTQLKLDYTYNNENDPNRFYYRSDHYNFAKKGIPIIFYFNGTHADYHQEGDEVSKINFPLLAKRAQLVFYTAWEVANREERIKADVIVPKKQN